MIVHDRATHPQLAGKIAVVTGGTQGLVAVIARAFAAAGAAGLVRRSRERDEQLDLREARTPTLFVAADLAVVDDCRAAIAADDRRFGSCDVLVNAAGITERGGILDTTEAGRDETFAADTRGPFLLMQEPNIHVDRTVVGASDAPLRVVA